MDAHPVFRMQTLCCNLQLLSCGHTCPRAFTPVSGQGTSEGNWASQEEQWGFEEGEGTKQRLKGSDEKGVRVEAEVSWHQGFRWVETSNWGFFSIPMTSGIESSFGEWGEVGQAFMKFAML